MALGSWAFTHFRYSSCIFLLAVRAEVGRRVMLTRKPGQYFSNATHRAPALSNSSCYPPDTSLFLCYLCHCCPSFSHASLFFYPCKSEGGDLYLQASTSGQGSAAVTQLYFHFLAFFLAGSPWSRGETEASEKPSCCLTFSLEAPQWLATANLCPEQWDGAMPSLIVTSLRVFWAFHPVWPL